MNRELPDNIHQKITTLCAEGDELSDAEHLFEAIAKYEQALALLPHPQHEWKAATWIYAALGDTCFQAHEFEPARKALSAAMLCPDALGNPFIWLRRGQVYFEIGDKKQAEDCLASAFMLGGREIFAEDDPKYSQFILPKLKPAVVSPPESRKQSPPPPHLGQDKDFEI